MGVKNTPVCTGCTYGRYIRVVFTGSAHRPLVVGDTGMLINDGYHSCFR